MNIANPLSYLSQKVVFEYTDANVRINLAKRIPSIRSIDQLTPLSINYLRLDDNVTVINDTKYVLKVFRKYPDNAQIPKHHEKENKEGGADYDINPFGFRDLEKHRNPGDIVLKGGGIDELQYRDDEEGKLELERLLAYFTSVRNRNTFLCDQIEKDSINQVVTVQDPFIFLNPTEDDDDGEEDDDQSEPGSDIDDMDLDDLDEYVSFSPSSREEIDRIEASLLPFQYGGTRPFDLFIQLITGSGTSIHTERFNYTKLHHAISLLRKKVFGGRRLITVNCLEIGMSSEILRIPFPLKFKVKNLKIMGFLGTTLEELTPVIDSSSFPLETLEAKLNLGDNADETVTKMLVINNERYISPDLIRNLKHPNIYCKLDRLRGREFPRLISNWVEMRMSIGFRISFSIHCREKAEKIIEVVRKRSENAVMENNK
ncbi:hypothetical protein GCK72_017541 [Caenorhabditis remanei]|uniref:Uncharacterized protein n=1 Tax=Caenorhabditis remanei TaxID=31234 RepID=A0A6A5G8Y7_CAERE|nr:hypothetical protein GCK72_017541 [Caenorhabditis remanei]KAF1750989.1 hypothetical protein GCK72_017541 [Caenorhabditis remanei]